MKLFDRIFGIIYGKKFLQKFYWKIYHFALKGLNFNIVGSGERKVLSLVKTKISNSPILFDVGANKGDYTRELISFFPEAEIHSFEPIPETFKKLQTLELKKGRINQQGLGRKSEKINMFYFPEAPTFSSQAKLSNIKFKNVEIEVDFISLEEYCKKHQINQIDFIKIDVEGFEMGVLEGGMNLLASQKIKAIQFEFGSQQIYTKNFFKDYFDLLDPHYAIYRILNDGLEEIKEYDIKHEIFRYSNYLALLKDLK